MGLEVLVIVQTVVAAKRTENVCFNPTPTPPNWEPASSMKKAVFSRTFAGNKVCVAWMPPTKPVSLANKARDARRKAAARRLALAVRPEQPNTAARAALARPKGCASFPRGNASPRRTPIAAKATVAKWQGLAPSLATAVHLLRKHTANKVSLAKQAVVAAEPLYPMLRGGACSVHPKTTMPARTARLVLSQVAVLSGKTAAAVLPPSVTARTIKLVVATDIAHESSTPRG